jgi:ribose transport system permease protein
VKNSKNSISAIMGRYEQIPLILALIAICVFLSFNSDVFFTFDNIMNVLRQSSIVLIAALGMTVALLAGQVDLSIGSLLAVVGIVTVSVYNMFDSVALAIIAAIAVGVIVGVLNGLLVTRTKINALIATLGMMSILRGIGYLSTNAQAVQTKGDTLKLIGTGYIGIVPVPVIIAGVMLIVFYYLLNHTTFGRYVYAVGGNEKAALSSGLPVARIQIWVFVIVAVTAALAGLIMTGRLNSFQPTIGAGFELNVIAAVILGGTRLTGGEGSISGTLLGVLILGVLTNGLVLMDVNSFWQEVVRGSVIILAVIFDEYRKRSNDKQAKKKILEVSDKKIPQDSIKEMA